MPDTTECTASCCLTALCSAKTPIDRRPLIGGEDARRAEGVFKMLANTTRLRLLHALIRATELCVSDLASELGMKPQAVSNQLQRLNERGIVGNRRNGNQIYYRIVDPCVIDLLDRGLCLSEDAEMRVRNRMEGKAIG